MADIALTLTGEELLDWLALILVPGLGPRGAGRLLERMKTPGAIFRASRSRLEAEGLSGAQAQSIASGCTYEDAALQAEKMRAVGAAGIPLSHPSYPPLLREILDPPPFLFVRGRVEFLQGMMVAVVGTRRPTPYGVSVAERLSGDLARAGLVIVSGMARGIDSAAHRGALAASEKTLAVLGCGVDVVYPSENKRLADEIAQNGLLVSEFPMSSPAFPQNFPIRNRIISGMCLGVLVVEGAQYSGSSITAKLAVEQGKEVFAIPGNITSKMSWGPNLLIKQGAKLVQEWTDVIEELPLEARQRLAAAGRNRILAQGGAANPATSGPEQASLPLGPAERPARALLDHLKYDTPTHVDELLGSVENCSSSEMLAALFELELLGMIKQLPGKHFVKVW